MYSNRDRPWRLGIAEEASGLIPATPMLIPFCVLQGQSYRNRQTLGRLNTIGQTDKGVGLFIQVKPAPRAPGQDCRLFMDTRVNVNHLSFA